MKLKIDLRPGTKLSESYSNSPDNYKIVEVDNVLGYSVSRGGPGSAASVRPIYRADIHVKVGKTWHMVSSYETGERLNGFTFYDDYEGCTFATIASQAVSALEERQRVQQLAKPAKSATKKPTTKKSKARR
jgi:hypothetical protein